MLNRRKSEPFTSKEIESIIKKLFNESLRPGGLTDEYYQTFKEEIIILVLKLFQKLEEETLPNCLLFGFFVLFCFTKPALP